MVKRLGKKWYPMTNKHMKKCSTSLVLRVAQIKTTVKFLYAPIRVTQIIKFWKTHNTVDQDVQQLWLSHTAHGSVNWDNHSGKLPKLNRNPGIRNAEFQVWALPAVYQECASGATLQGAWCSDSQGASEKQRAHSGWGAWEGLIKEQWARQGLTHRLPHMG